MTLSLKALTRWITPALFALAGLATVPAAQANDVSVSIGFSQPGAYGRVDIGRYPAPVLVAPRPVVIGRPVHRAEPVYLWVPTEHRRDWRRHCYHYGACGAPVYFVQDGWYRQNVVVHHPRHRHAHHDRHDRHGRDHDHRRGHGHGHGHRD